MAYDDKRGGGGGEDQQQQQQPMARESREGGHNGAGIIPAEEGRNANANLVTGPADRSPLLLMGNSQPSEQQQTQQNGVPSSKVPTRVLH
jgi:hypothetical protein